MSESAFVFIFISVGLIVVIDLIFIACCLIVSSRTDKEDK